VRGCAPAVARGRSAPTPAAGAAALPVLAAPRDLLLKPSDHDSLGKKIAKYFDAKQNNSGIDKAKEDLSKEIEGDEKVGVNIVRRALEQPLRTLCENAGIEGSIVVEKVKSYKGEDKFTGYDVDGEKYVDMFKAGIVDPTKVTRYALQNAASVAAMVLTTQCMITDVPASGNAPAMPATPNQSPSFGRTLPARQCCAAPDALAAPTISIELAIACLGGNPKT